MSLFGSSDAASNASVMFAQQLKVTPNTDNRTALFGNTTADGFISGRVDGVFAVDTTEIGVSGRSVQAYITNNGTGYTANATVTFDNTGTGGTGAAANAQSNSVGKIAAINVTNDGSDYGSAPTLTISAPASTSFNSDTAVSNTADVITLSSAGNFEVGDQITYAVAAGNTAVSGLTDGTTYFVSFANSTVVALAATSGGANIDITAATTGETGHTLTGITAAGYISLGGNPGIAHTGWHLRTVGSGGRAGRTTYECLVAGGIVTDASDDTILPES